MTPSAFAALMLPYARQVQAARGIDAWAVITQWALETGNGSSALFLGGHNPAGMTGPDPRTGDTTFKTYPSLQAGVTDYIAFLGLGYYTGILATAGQPVPAVLAAMGQSLWDAGHYGTPPGQSLQDLWASTYAAIAGQPATTESATSLYSSLWAGIVGLERAASADYVPAPWAAAQGLSGEHLGTVPSVDQGGTYMVQMLQGVAVSLPGSHVFASPSVIPAGATDPAIVLGPVYVALVNVARAAGTGLLGVPWAAAQGLSGEHFGHPPDLDTGVSYLEGQVDALTRFLSGGVPAPLPTTVPPAGSGSPPVTAPPASGGGIPLPQPPASGGAGQSGLEAAWSNLLALITQTLPAAAARVDAALSGQGGGGPRPPTPQ